MLLIGLLFALFTVGFVVPCLVDVARTPEFAVRSLTKKAWLAVIILLSVIGGVAWLVAGRPTGRWQAPLMYRPLAGSRGRRQREAFRRHPAGRDQELDFGTASSRGAFPACARPAGPDDDPEFLLELARRIRGDREADNDA
jgi:Phospholipase_D-nuclease N-terminal